MKKLLGAKVLILAAALGFSGCAHNAGNTAENSPLLANPDAKTMNFIRVVLFDPETVADLGDFVRPDRGNTGFACVVVNGEIALENDQTTGALAGKLLFRDTP